MRKWLEIKQGSSRIVVIITPCGVAVKFPIIRIGMVGTQIWHHLQRPRHWKHGLSKFLAGEIDLPFSMSWCLFKNIAANWQEYQFYRNTRNIFLWPTNFSLLGLVNFQRYGPSTSLTSADLYKMLYKIAGDDLYRDSHCFASARNFCVTAKGELRLTDYASEGSQTVVLKHGEIFATLSGSHQ